MASGRVDIPSDETLGRMSPEQLSRLANEIAKGDRPERGLEWLSDALKRVDRGRRIARRLARREVVFSDLDDVDLVAPIIDDNTLQGIVDRATAAGCTARQCHSFLLADMCVSQERAAELMGISQSAYSRLLARARKAICSRLAIQGDATLMFSLESRRATYRKPSPRPLLPRYLKCRPVDIEAARELIEERLGAITAIMPDALDRVEVYRPNREPMSLSFQRLVAWADKLRRKKIFA
jgi:hypothetical protein